jgi:hypothetical protein
MAARLAFVYSREFRGWMCNQCDWRFPVDPKLVFTDAQAEEVVGVFDQHRCSGCGRVDAAANNSRDREVPMDKKSNIADWVVPLVVWLAALGFFVSLLVALLKPAGW